MATKKKKTKFRKQQNPGVPLKGMALNNPYPNVPAASNNLPGFNFPGAGGAL